MDKANTLLRRSGARLRTIGSSHPDLSMVIAQLRDLKSSSRAFASAQQSALDDLVRWSVNNDNKAVQDAVCQVGEMFKVWAEVQNEFAEGVRDFRAAFERIQEGERALDAARAKVDTAVAKENKTRKELKKNATEEGLQEKASLAEREKELAQVELFDLTREHEIVKMIRVKDGLLKFNQAYLDLASKADIIFQANKFIAEQIPDVTDERIHEIKYTGAARTMQKVIDTKEEIKHFRRRNSHRRSSLVEDLIVPPPGMPRGRLSLPAHMNGMPPPYSENQPPMNPFYDAGGGGFVTPHNVSNASNNDASFTSPDLFAPDLNGSNSDRRRVSTSTITSPNSRNPSANTSRNGRASLDPSANTSGLSDRIGDLSFR